MTDKNPPLDARDMAALDLLRRMGMTTFQLRYSDDPPPIVWMALAEFTEGWQTAAEFTPSAALLQLCDLLLDGGTCLHCQRTTGFAPDLGSMPMGEFVCWYQYDPELKTFRRACE